MFISLLSIPPKGTILEPSTNNNGYFFCLTSIEPNIKTAGKLLGSPLSLIVILQISNSFLKPNFLDNSIIHWDVIGEG